MEPFITTATDAAAAGPPLIAVLLIALLIQKEIAGALAGERAQRLNRALNVAIVPVGIVFVINAALTVAAALR